MFDYGVIMNKRELSQKAGVSQRHLEYLLRAERNASPQLALRLERITKIDRGVWVFGTPTQRRRAWKNFQQGDDQK